MKHRIPRNAVLAVAAAAVFLAGTLSQGQAPVPASDDPALRQMASEVLTQHLVIAENQTKIEAKLTQLAETIRLARIYASRSGKGAN